PFQGRGQGFESPPGYTTAWILALVAVRLSLRAFLCCEGHFSIGRFSFRALRGAVNGDGARRRSSIGLAFVYRSTMRPVVHPPSVMRSIREPEAERWKIVAHVWRSMCAQRSGIPLRTARRSKSFRTP